MKNTYKIIALIVGLLALLLPSLSFALTMPQSANDLATYANLTAQAYIVQDIQTGEILISHNADQQITPASLTKLVTALVVLDSKVSLSKTVAITKDDQTLGACTSGGACIKAVPGIKFTVDALFHAALMPSANNAASALARSTGLSMNDFVARMNKKVVDLGATQSHFNEPTGMDGTNIITAGDYVKIVKAAFSNKYLQKISGLSSYYLRSSNNSKYNQTIKNTDKLLATDGIKILGAKTGYLDSYNFASLLKYNNGPELAIVVLGTPHLYSAFDETKLLADIVAQSKLLSFLNTNSYIK